MTAAFLVFLSSWQVKNSGGRNTYSSCKVSSDPSPRGVNPLPECLRSPSDVWLVGKALIYKL